MLLTMIRNFNKRPLSSPSFPIAGEGTVGGYLFFLSQLWKKHEHL